MFYKKNQSKKLNKQLFFNPTSEYRGTPFWAWNCKMDIEILDEQIEYLKMEVAVLKKLKALRKRNGEQ